VGHHHQIVADLVIPPAGAEGVILAQGSRYGGFTLYVKDNHVVYEVNAYSKLAGRIISEAPLAPGAAHIELEVVPDTAAAGGGELTILGPRGVRPGTVVLTVNGAKQQVRFDNVLGASPTETLDVGSDLGSAVSTAYTSPNRFTGTIGTVTIALK
jgi:arylsulfatase